jgi:hypothetical protein
MERDVGWETASCAVKKESRDGGSVPALWIALNDVQKSHVRSFISPPETGYRLKGGMAENPT